MNELYAIEDRRRDAAQVLHRGLSLWTLGMRPFYLLAALQAALAVPLWILQWLGFLPAGTLPGAAGHAHEMLLGFMLAVLTGFLFAAAHKWTGLHLPVGFPLMALAVLWLLARILAWTPSWFAAAALANLCLALLVAWALIRVLWRAGKHHNLFLPTIVLGLALLSLFMHAAQAGLIGLAPANLMPLALDGVAYMLTVMGGRLAPGFTNSALANRPARRWPWLERSTPLTVLFVMLADLFMLSGSLGETFSSLLLLGALSLCAALQFWRWWLWRPWTTLGQPLLWVLHAGYAWLVVHFVLRTEALLSQTSATYAWHALTMGALGLLSLGMMTRSARGHTGHPLRADRWDVASYVALAIAAPLRVLVPLFWPQLALPGIVTAALLWSAAFTIFLVRYTPMLIGLRGRVFAGR